MSRTRRALGATAGVVLAALFAAPAAAQPSVNAELINNLNLDLLYVAVPITVLVEGILIYTVYKYRNNDDPSPTQENRRLEITWTIATALILLFVGLASYQVLGSAFVGGAIAGPSDGGDGAELATLQNDYPGATAPTEANALQIEVQSQKYLWRYRYPAGQEFALSRTGQTVTLSKNITKTSSAGEPLVIPANTPVYLHITSVDWLHAFHVPDLALKQDAFPGQYNTIKTRTMLPEGQSQASYQLYCAEYCGVGHSQMLGTVTVMDQQSFAQWVQQNQQGGSGSGDGSGGNSTTTASGDLATVALAN